MVGIENQEPVVIVLGGQWGSEGKGEIVGRLVQEYGAVGEVSVVRTGGPQAGHSVTFDDGRKFSVCQIPCGFHVPNARMFVGPGSEIDPTRLASELEMLEEFNIKERLFLDPRSTILEQEDKDAEKHGGLTERLGSTAKGIGACRARRIMRTAPLASGYDDRNVAEFTMFRHMTKGHRLNGGGGMAPQFGMQYPGRVVIETSQGYGLSLTSAGYYPFCTSTDIVPGRAMADAGISSRHPHRVVMVVRTFPIRVHGNSGPMPGEIGWDELYKLSEGRSPATGELTTVTKKVRRIARFDWSLFKAAVEACTPDAIVVSFMDYLSPKLADETNWEVVFQDLVANAFINDVEAFSQAPVVAVATGAGKIATRPGMWPIIK